MPESPAAMRERFEKWQIQPIEWRVMPTHPNGGYYADGRIETEWIVWQAAEKAAQPSSEKIEEVAEVLRKSVYDFWKLGKKPDFGQASSQALLRSLIAGILRKRLGEDSHGQVRAVGQGPIPSNQVGETER